MLISKAYDYAIRILRALAAVPRGEQLTLDEICQREHVPRSFGSKIARMLTAAELLEGNRGTNGGYRLAVPLERISIYDIGVAVDGVDAINRRMAVNRCTLEDESCPNYSRDGVQCAVHGFLCEVQNEIVHKLKAKSMADLLSGRLLH